MPEPIDPVFAIITATVLTVAFLIICAVQKRRNHS
jgi:hypothetical protein